MKNETGLFRAVSGLLNGITITYCAGLLRNRATTSVKAFEVPLLGFN